MWDTDNRVALGQPMDRTEGLLAIAVSPDGNRLAVSGFVDGGQSMQVWDVRRSAEVFGRKLEDTFISALTFSPDGRVLGTVTSEGVVGLLNAEDGSRLRDLIPSGATEGDRSPNVSTPTFSPDGRTVAAGGSSLQVWNAVNGDPLRSSGLGSTGVTSLAFTSDGSRIITANTDRTVEIRDARSGLPIGDPLTFLEPVTQVAAAPGDNGIVSISGRSLQLSNGTPDATLADELEGSEAAQLSGSSQRWLLRVAGGPIIIVLRDNELRLLDGNTGEHVIPPVVDDAMRDLEAIQVDISPDRRWLAVADSDTGISVMDASNGMLYGQPLKGNAKGIDRVVFNPDGNTLANIEDSGVRLWDWRSGRTIAGPAMGHELGLLEIAFSRDGQFVYSMSLDSMHVWDRQLRPVGEVVAPETNISTWALSPNGNRFVVVEGDKAQQYDAKTAQKINEPLQGHFSDVLDLEYTSDGDYLVVVRQDATLEFWDTDSGNQVGTTSPTTETGFPVDVALSPDDRQILITLWNDEQADGSVSGGGVWQVPGPPTWTELLCSKLRANPTQDQWEQWVSSEVDYEVDYEEACPAEFLHP